MAYRQGEYILASDFNTFRTDLLNVYDVGFGDAGYGQLVFGGATAVPFVAIGELIKSSEWTIFRNAAQTCSNHQGNTSTSFPPASELAVSELVEAHDFLDGNAYDIDGSLAAITSDRLSVAPGSVTVFSNALNSVRGTAWSAQLQHRFTVSFGVVDEARYFFNSGGQIRIRGSRSGGSATSQNLSWTNMLLNMGRITMNYTSTTLSGGGAGWTINQPNVGYYDLSTSFVTIATGLPDGGGYGGYGGYPGNSVTIEARSQDGPGGANGDNGRTLEFRVLYTDGHSNPFFDSVDGTITSDVDYRKATTPLTIPTPVFSTSVPLTSGS